MSRYYGTAAWKRLRAEVLRRQPVCATPGCGLRAVHVDHIVPRSKGGADALPNLRGLCPQCHNMRRQGGEPRAKGCDVHGNPRDATHWWKAENLSEPRGADRCGPPRGVSSDSSPEDP